jgi:hypothetical protein
MYCDQARSVELKFKCVLWFRITTDYRPLDASHLIYLCQEKCSSLSHRRASASCIPSSNRVSSLKRSRHISLLHSLGLSSLLFSPRSSLPLPLISLSFLSRSLSLYLSISFSFSLSPHATRPSRILSSPLALTSGHLSPPCILAPLLTLRMNSCISHQIGLALYLSCALTSMSTYTHRYTSHMNLHVHTNAHLYAHAHAHAHAHDMHMHMHMHKHKNTYTNFHAHTCKNTSHLAHVRIRTGTCTLSWHSLSSFSSRSSLIRQELLLSPLLCKLLPASLALRLF